jgi:hypothetical protein
VSAKNCNDCRDHVTAFNAEWQRACEYVGERTDAELRTLAQLNVPGGLGLAVEQERGRRRSAQ